MKVKSESEVAQSYPTLSNPMDCSLPGSSFHGRFQARVLEWVPFLSPEDPLANYFSSAVMFLLIALTLRKEREGTPRRSRLWLLEKEMMLRYWDSKFLLLCFPRQYSCLENLMDGGAW